MIRKFRYVLLVISLGLVTSIASAQVATGIPPYSSLGGGPDAINLANLNAHFAFPVLHKPGRGGLNFNFDLTYDSSFWQQITYEGSTYWNPVATDGWSGSSVNVGYLYYAGEVIEGVVYYCDFIYFDGFGTAHPFAGCAEYDSNNGADYPLDSIAVDGSGYTIAVDAYYETFQLTSSDGNFIIPQNTPSLNPTISTGSVIDRNGNEITVDTSGNFKDTLGVVALKSAGGLPNPYTLSYTSPAGPASVTVTFKPHTLQTNFLCSGIKDFPATPGYYLVDRVTLPDGTFYQFAYEQTPGFSANTTGRLASITLPTGGQISYLYTGGNAGIECSDGSTSGLRRTTPDGTWTYTRALGTGAASTTTVTDPEGNVTVIQFQGIFETQRQIYQGSSTLLETTITCYNKNTTNCPTTAITLPITERTTFLQWPSGAESKTNIFYNNYGLETEVDEYGYTAFGYRTTIVTYAPLGAIQNKPSTVSVVYDKLVHASTTYCYDEAIPSGTTTCAAVGPPTPTSGLPQHVAAPGGNVRGNLTSLVRSVTPETTVGKTMTYNDTGSLLIAKDFNGNPTTYSYSSTYGGAYPTTVTNALNQSTTFVYDANTGVGSSMKDANQQQTNYTYDNRLRPLTIGYPDGGETTFDYISATEASVSARIDNAGDNQVGYVEADGLGRLNRVAIANGEATPYDQVDICYNSLGLAGFQSYPYQGSGLGGAAMCSGAGDSFVYDALGRPTSVSHADGSAVKTAYTGQDTSVSDEGNGTRPVQRVFEADGLGRLASVCEVTNATQQGTQNNVPTSCGQVIAATGFLTTYGYDELNNLTEALFGAQSALYTYDELSRLTGSSNVENYKYTYDSNGNVISKTAPEPNQTGSALVTITYKYDALNRITSRSYSDGTPTANFVYDKCPTSGCPSGYSATPNTVGRLVESYTSNTATFESYDPVGRVANEWQCTPQNCGSGYFPLAYTYDFLGDITSSSNGAGVTLSSSYNVGAQLTKLTSSLVDSNHPATLFSNATYNALGAMYSGQLGNGISQTRAYDARLRVKSITDGAVYNVAVTYAPNSNVITSNDSVNGNWNYGTNSSGLNGYDDFNRLTLATTSGGSTAYSNTYDRYGNRWQQLLNGACTAGTSFCMTFNTENQSSLLSYDAYGNVISDSAHTYTYDAENRLTSVDGGSTATYVYDANGRRVRKTHAGLNYDYLYDLSGHVITVYTGGWARGEVYIGNRHLATYTNGTTYFAHADWLGTERARSTVAGAVCETITSLPFGDGQVTSGSCGDPSPLHFSGIEGDSESNLDNFPVRYYASSIGRFTTRDPAKLLAVDTSNPQTWNNYLYTGNNPTTLTDPTGLCDPDDPSCGGGCDLSDPSCGGGGCFFSCGGGGGTFNPGPPPAGATPSTFPTNPGSAPSWQTLIFGPIDPSQFIIFNAFPNGICIDSQGHLVNCSDPNAVVDCSEASCSSSTSISSPPDPGLVEHLKKSEKPNCWSGVFVNSTLNALDLPALPAGSDFGDAMRAGATWYAIRHAVNAGIRFNRQSSILRNVAAVGEGAAEAAALIPALYQVGTGLVAEVKAIRAGTCKTAGGQ
jgi:RHS repeat-associated protein